MARYRVFSVHDLYPADYSFDYEAFSADPETYIFTADDIAYYNAMELERYEREVPMSPYERKLLRRWVISGHNPRENAGSKYLCLTGSEPYDFLTVYRMDREIQRDMKGMKKAEQEAYLKTYMGWTDDPINDDPWIPVDDQALGYSDIAGPPDRYGLSQRSGGTMPD